MARINIGGETEIRLIAAAIGAFSALALLISFHFLLSGTAERLLIDRQFASYPLTVQNVMWIVYGIGFAELWIRHRGSSREINVLKREYLPEDHETLLRAEDLGQFYRLVTQDPKTQECFLTRLISRVILQFQSSRSVDQSNSLLNSSLELYQHEIDLRYNMLRYIVWVIPTLGFLGTVIGIANALEGIAEMRPDDESLLRVLTSKLGTAFFTTLLALVMSGILVFFMHIVQGREERALNLSGQYCLDNLINRLYER
ncbi:MAG: MotA/TolQ/ExbB proton channel family protein [Alphaproteobacteria bacterium]|tara:strand:+ start:538 stop:1308 length:771 start_codon:yes stop_codon:yes gene_type:complete